MSEHPDFRVLLADLVERHGGVEKFSPVQREVAGVCVGLMLDMRSAAPGDLVRHADALRRLVEQLPPVVAPSYSGPRRDVMTLSLEEATQRYAQMVADEGDYGDDLDFTAYDAAKETARKAARAAYDAAIQAACADARGAPAGTATDALAAEPPHRGAESVAAPAEPSPGAEPEVEILPPTHNAGNLVVRKPPPPPARRGDYVIDRRYGDVHRGERFTPW